MPKWYNILLLALFWLGSLSGQNLIQNWDFSTKSPGSPPYGNAVSPIERASIWSPNRSPNGWPNNHAGTAHYYLTPYYQILNMPKPFVGDAIGFLWFYVDLSIPNTGRLSIHRNTLSQQLVKDTVYCVETHVRAWPVFFNGFRYGHTHKNLGFYFSADTALPSNEPWNDGVVPQVWNNTGYIDNDTAWRQVKGSFTATGGEQYLYLGNFDPLSDPPMLSSPSTHPWKASMVWFDAVMVYNCHDTVFSISLPDTTVCHGTPVQLQPLVQGFKLLDSVRTYTWHTPMGSFTQTDSTFLATQPGTYTLEVEINHRFTATQTITVNWLEPKPDTALLPEQLPWCRFKPVPLAVPAINNTSYSWNTGSTDTAILAEAPGTYTVTLTHPCWQHTAQVELVPENCLDIFVPNAFTPDGDGINDYFEIKGANTYNGLPLQLTVVDRWGNVVYQNSNYQNNWDGTHQGKPLPEGVYTYRIVYRLNIDTHDYVKQGTISILR